MRFISSIWYSTRLKMTNFRSSLSQSRELLASSTYADTVPSALESLKKLQEQLLQQQREDREILSEAFPLVLPAVLNLHG